MEYIDDEYEYKLLLACGVPEEELTRTQSPSTVPKTPVGQDQPFMSEVVRQTYDELRELNNQNSLKRKQLHTNLMEDHQVLAAMNQIRDIMEKTAIPYPLRVETMEVPEELWDETRFTQSMLIRLSKVTPDWLRAGVVLMPQYNEVDYLKGSLSIPWYGLKFCRVFEQVPAFGTLVVQLQWGHKEKKTNDWRWPNIVMEKGKTFNFLYDFTSREWIGVRLDLRDKKSQIAQDEIPRIRLWDERVQQHTEYNKFMIPFSRHFRLLLKDVQSQLDHIGSTSKFKIKLYKLLQSYMEQVPTFMDTLVFNGEMSEFARTMNLKVVERVSLVLKEGLVFLESLGSDDYTFKNGYSDDPLDKKDQLDRISVVKKEHYSEMDGYMWSNGANFFDFIEETVKPLFETRDEVPMDELREDTATNRQAKKKGVLAVDPESRQIARTVVELERLRGRTEIPWNTEDQIELDAWLLRHL